MIWGTLNDHSRVGLIIQQQKYGAIAKAWVKIP
jgi:hypothetical protein